MIHKSSPFAACSKSTQDPQAKCLAFASVKQKQFISCQVSSAHGSLFCYDQETTIRWPHVHWLGRTTLSAKFALLSCCVLGDRCGGGRCSSPQMWVTLRKRAQFLKNPWVGGVKTTCLVFRVRGHRKSGPCHHDFRKFSVCVYVCVCGGGRLLWRLMR